MNSALCDGGIGINWLKNYFSFWWRFVAIYFDELRYPRILSVASLLGAHSEIWRYGVVGAIGPALQSADAVAHSWHN